MELLNFIFHLGVLFAIYGFLWGIFEILLTVMSSGRTRTLTEIYFLRGIKYFFLVNVTFIFCFENSDSDILAIYKIVLAGLVLLTYFAGKLKKNRMKSLFISAVQGRINNQSNFNFKSEKLVITLSMLSFILFWVFPDAAVNPISIWFRDAIINIENTPVFGFIFKVIGFFFLLNLIGKMIGTVNYFINGGKTSSNDDFTDNNSLGNDSDGGDFVEYEEVD